MRALLALGLSSLATLALGQSCNPAEPRTDPGTTFAPFATLERLEVHAGPARHQKWEWALGTNTHRKGSFVKANLDWVSGRVLTYTLSYNGAGVGTFTVDHGAKRLATRTWNDPAKPLRTGNALKLHVKASAHPGTATVKATVATINGLPASGSIQTAGNGRPRPREQAMYWFFPPLAKGFTVTGTVTLTFRGSKPRQGSQLHFIVTAGNIPCQEASAPPGLYFIHVDHLNTPRLVANQEGQTVWRWDQQEPFGVNAPDENPSGPGTFELPLRLPGQYFDQETGLHYNYYRDYDPGIGRYEESDPIGLKGGLNVYTYGYGNPLALVDPNGLEVEVGIRKFYPLGFPLVRHCFVRFKGNDLDTLSFTPSGVGPDANPGGGTYSSTIGPENDSCVRKQMLKCRDYAFFTNNCCDCVGYALDACGLNKVGPWPNYIPAGPFPPPPPPQMCGDQGCPFP